MSKAISNSVNSHLDGKEPVVKEIYDTLIENLRLFGPVLEEPKKTSIHLVNVTAFAGIATRRNAIVLTIKSNRDLESTRIHKSEQTSARRFHHEVKLTKRSDIDDELIAWLREGYALSG